MNFYTKMSISGKIIFVLFIMILIYFISSYISIRINYKPIFDWWKQYDGENYKKLFNLFTLCAFNDSIPIYYLSKFLSTPAEQLSSSQNRFIIGELLPYLRVVQDDVQSGLIIPRHMCESIMLSPKDGDNAFDIWFSQAQRNGLPIKEGAPLIYNRNSGTKHDVYIRYTYSIQENTGDSSGFYGLYPKPGDRDSWAGIILEWLGDGWVMQTDVDGLIHPTVTDPTMENSMSTWFTTDWKITGRPDNFLARMGITPDSPLVIYFINNTFSTPETGQVDSNALMNLLAPSGANAGGWIGYLNGMDKLQYDQYVVTIRSKVPNPQRPPTPSTPCTGKNVGKGLITGITSAAPLLGFAIATGGVGGVAIGLAALLTGGLTGFQTGAGSC